ncbi:MAG: tetratricopeptide repeat protein [Bacillati bacterium ANGP1]|uniref:Tetratricopeptide repeat protein n=1 Tax=Candidatus Segetimicrobium genomatis TaxID=2569760 RepID=A0A537JMF4_9BACT|nr:MAG: tetratricopeptide repeat protein [Terrabacteria group bacterium ANGP1]
MGTLLSRFVGPALLALALGLGWPSPPASSATEDDLQKAVDAYSRGNLVQARVVLESLQPDPGPLGGRAAYLLGVIDLQQRKFAPAEAVFSQAADKLPILADHAHYYRAVAAFYAGDYRLAVEAFQAVLSRYPTSTLRGLALFWEAESLWGVHSPDAPAAFHHYLEEYGEGAHAAQAWFDMGEAFVELGRWDDAASAYRRIRWGFEGSPFWQPAWARLTALARAHHLALDTTPPEVFYRRALADIGAGEFRAARAELLRALAMPSGWRVADDALFQLGVLSYQRGRPDEAAGYFRRDADLRAAHADDSLYWLEKIALRRNRENDALAFARELLQMYPGSPFAPRSLYAIAEVRGDKGDLGPALGLFREAGARFPETEYGQRALWAVGWVQYQARQWGAARDEWLRIARGSSGEVAPAAHYWAARAADALGRVDQARDEYRQVAAHYPDSYYGQRAAARASMRVRAAVVPLPEIPPGELLSFDRYRELDALAQIDDAVSELAAAAEKAPQQYQAAVGAILSQRYVLQGEVGHGITVAEQIRDLVGGAGQGLPLILWESLYPQVYWEAITQAAARMGIDPYLVAGVIREESRFNPQAVSPSNAYGLMQLVPVTARNAARRVGIRSPNSQTLRDPKTNVLLGSVVLQELLGRFSRVDLALAAYNAGPQMVGRWQAKRGAVDPEVFVEEIPYLETRSYVKTVMQSAAMYAWLYRDGHPSSTP